MAPYLHFGQISPLYLALKIMQTPDALDTSKKTYLEELIVRRELTMNFTTYTPDYNSYQCIPEWAGKSLAVHKKDKREYNYSRRILEKAETHDPYWNASMLEMKHTGFMHNYMRMYWGKKSWNGHKLPSMPFEQPLPLTTSISWTAAIRTPMPEWPGYTVFMTDPGKNDLFLEKYATWPPRVWNERATSPLMSIK